MLTGYEIRDRLDELRDAVRASFDESPTPLAAERELVLGIIDTIAALLDAREEDL